MLLQEENNMIEAKPISRDCNVGDIVYGSTIGGTDWVGFLVEWDSNVAIVEEIIDGIKKTRAVEC